MPLPRVRILPYKMGSGGASRIAEGLRARGTKCMKVFPDRNYYPKKGHFLINWGTSQRPDWYSSRFCSDMLNKPPNVELASNKLHAFQAWESWNEAMPDDIVPIPEFTTDRAVVYDDWLQAFPYPYSIGAVARTILQGHSGKGIVPIYHACEYGIEGRDWPDAPLYVKYIKKSAEYRIHVFKGEVIDIQMKRKRRLTPNEEVNYQVRSHAGGWVFCRSDATPPDGVRQSAVNAIRALGLDFGAVDIIYNQHYRKPYVLEVNTAPGLEGQTITTYVNAIRSLL